MNKSILSQIFAFLMVTLISAGTLKPQINEMVDYNASFSVYTNNIYGSGQEVSLTIYAYNIRKKAEFGFKVYKIRDLEGFFSRQTSTYSIEVLSKDSTNLLSLCDEVDNFSRRLKTDGYDEYYYSYETVTYKPKGKGAFVVRVSYKNKVAYTGYFVTDVGMITEASNSGLLAFTVDRLTGEPVSGANLSFYFGQRKLGIGTTSGGLFYKALDESDRKYAAENELSFPLVIGYKDDNVIISDPYLYFGYGSNMHNVYIFTNQPVYRPKSPVQFKGIIRKSDGGEYSNFPSQDVTVTIKDSRNAEVYKEILRTNQAGSFNGEYTVDQNAPLGTYYIYAVLGENQQYTATFSVEEYKKPEYKVDISVDRDQYTDGDDIRGIVQADYYFGSPVQEAEVEYNVYKQTFYKPWWYFSEYRWWYEDYYENLDENAKYNNAEFIFSGTGKLDKDGRFDFSYAVKEDFKSKYNYYWWYDYEGTYETDYMYIIQAKVTDKSRRQISSTKTVYVTRAQFYLNSNTDKYLYKPGEKVTLEVRSYDFSDKPVSTGFEATVHRLTWGKYPDYKKERTFVATVEGKTREDGSGMVAFDADSEGYYEIEVKAFDSKGKKVTAQTYCYVSKGDMWWWYNQSGAVQIIPDKESYKPGEVCKAMIITTTPGASVLLTTQNDNILSYRVEKLDGMSKMVEIPVDGTCSPNFYINASYVNGGQFYTSSRSVMVIPDDKFLNVIISTDKLTYKPKEEGTLLIKVLDNNGNSVSGADVSIGIVDESVYAIKPDNTKDIRKAFYSPKWNTVAARYSSSYSYYGYSRLITIFERFNVKSLSDTELGTIKGRLIDKNENVISSAWIVIDGDFLAAVTDGNGEFEFKLPEGEYSVGVMQGKKTRESEKELTVKKGRTVNITLRAEQEGVFFGTLEQGLLSNDGAMDDITAQTRAPMKSEEMETGRSLDKKDRSKGEDESGVFVEAELRSDFRDAIMWLPSVETDGDGYASVKVNFPDNLTTWRITSRVITNDTKVGQFVNTVITRKDLLVRMETPRFFQQNDEVTISTIIHNYLSEDKQTKVSLKVENLLLNSETNEQLITLGKNEEKRIDWKVKVTEPVGFAKLTATALTDEESDAVELKVPLQPHGLQLAQFQAMDVSDFSKTEVKYVTIPEYTDLRSTNLKLSISPSLASTMLTALDELVGYPYGCVEQTMSRFLPTVIVANAFHDLNAPISDATKKDLPKMVEAGYNRLYSLQHYDGGWGWWTNDQTHPFMTSYVVYGLALGDASGQPVRKDVLDKGVSSIKSQLKSSDLDPTTRAYMLYAVSFVEKKDTKLFEEQFRILSGAELNDYASALLSMAARNIGDNTLADSYIYSLKKNVQDFGEGGAYWGGQAWHYNWQDDKVQTTAMAVKALIADPAGVAGNSELLNKAIRWLLMQRHGGGWNSTQETAFIVYAIVDYLKNSKELEPDYDVKIFLNNEQVLDKHMTKEDIFKKEWNFEFPGGKLKDGPNEVRIEKTGSGKVYVASHLTYYTNEEKIHPRENGFRVEKEYFKLEKYKRYSDERIVYKKRYFDGSVRSGDEILVKVRVSTKENNLQYFMLEDPIPAGCEVIKDDWAYTIEDEKDYTGWDYYWWRWWYADKDIRDNRVTFFATYLWGETYEFTYIIRAQIPGTYSVIPATGMLMYYPEVRGSSEELRIKIED